MPDFPLSTGGDVFAGDPLIVNVGVIRERTSDPVHPEIGFSVRHMMVGKVRGRFSRFDARWSRLGQQ